LQLVSNYFGIEKYGMEWIGRPSRRSRKRRFEFEDEFFPPGETDAGENQTQDLKIIYWIRSAREWKESYKIFEEYF